MPIPSVINVAISESRYSGEATAVGSAINISVGIVSESYYNTAEDTTVLSTPTVTITAMNTTASYAQSASYARTAGDAQTAITAVTASYALSNAGVIQSAVSSSYAANATLFDGNPTEFFLTASNIAAGSLSNARLPAQISVTGVSASLVAPVATVGQLRLDAGTARFVTTGSVTSGIFGVTEYMTPRIPTDTFSGVVIEYVAQRPMGLRLGMLLGLWSGSDVTFTDVSTSDIGDTEDLSLSIVQIGEDMVFRVNSDGVGTGAWTIQSVFKLFPQLT